MSDPIAERIKALYPAPIAATYSRMTRIGGQEAQAREKHERLLSLFQSILQYLGLVGTLHYRKWQLSVQIPSTGAKIIEERISSLDRPSLGQWMGLAESTARALQNAPGLPLISKISRFLFDIPPDPVGSVAAAHRAIAEWYPKGRPDKAKPGSYAAFLNRFIAYRNSAVGHAIELPPSNWEYSHRLAVLLPAFDALLQEMEFLTKYPLAFVNEMRTYTEGTITHELVLFMGRESTTEEYRSPRTQNDLEAVIPKHVYLCSRDMGLKPVLDLHPFFIGGLCEHDGLALFPYFEGGSEAPVFLCCLCSAERLDLEKQIERDQRHLVDTRGDLQTIFSAERWGETQKRKARDQVLPQLVGPVRYVLQKGRIDANDVDFLEHTRRMCNASPEDFPSLLVATIVHSGLAYGPDALESLRASYDLERTAFIRLLVEMQVTYRQWGDDHSRVLGAMRELYHIGDTEFTDILLEAALADHELDEGELTYLLGCVRASRIDMLSMLQSTHKAWPRTDVSKSVRTCLLELFWEADLVDAEPRPAAILRHASQSDTLDTVCRLLEFANENGTLVKADLLGSAWRLWGEDDISATQRARMLEVIQRAYHAEPEELALASLTWAKGHARLPLTEAALISFFVNSGLDEKEAKRKLVEIKRSIGFQTGEAVPVPPILTPPSAPVPLPAAKEDGSPSENPASMKPMWTTLLPGVATHVAMLKAESAVLVTTDKGEGLILDGHGKIVARRGMGGRVHRLVADGAGTAAIGSWEGEVHYVHDGAFAWHDSVNGVVGALALGGRQLPLVVGAWSGAVVAFAADGRSVWPSSLTLPDAISSVAIAEGDVAVLAATSGGMVALYDSAGNIRWQRDYRDPIVHAAFLPPSTDLVIAQMGGVLRCISDDQIQRWEYEAKSSFARIFILPASREILAVTFDGRLIFLSYDGQVDRVVKVDFAIGDAVATANGQHIFVSADRVGVLALECASQNWTHEYGGRPGPMTSSMDGTRLAVAEGGSLTVLRSPQPEVSAEIEWKLALQVGRFSLVTVVLTNHGKRAARSLEVELLGEIEFAKGEVHAQTIERLEINGERRLEWSIRPNTSGYIPLRIHIGLRDDAGNRFDESRLIRVEALPAV